jgi:hypothetical protein
MIQNVELALAFSLAPQESIEAYDLFHKIFRSEVGIDITRYVLLSDQGASIKAIGGRHPLPRSCPRHLLQRLNIYQCGQAVRNLVKARGRKRFEVLCELDRRHFSILFARGGADWNDRNACTKT